MKYMRICETLRGCNLLNGIEIANYSSLSKFRELKLDSKHEVINLNKILTPHLKMFREDIYSKCDERLLYFVYIHLLANDIVDQCKHILQDEGIIICNFSDYGIDYNHISKLRIYLKTILEFRGFYVTINGPDLIAVNVDNMEGEIHISNILDSIELSFVTFKPRHPQYLLDCVASYTAQIIYDFLPHKFITDVWRTAKKYEKETNVQTMYKMAYCAFFVYTTIYSSVPYNNGVDTYILPTTDNLELLYSRISPQHKSRVKSLFDNLKSMIDLVQSPLDTNLTNYILNTLYSNIKAIEHIVEKYFTDDLYCMLTNEVDISVIETICYNLIRTSVCASQSIFDLSQDTEINEIYMVEQLERQEVEHTMPFYNSSNSKTPDLFNLGDGDEEEDVNEDTQEEYINEDTIVHYKQVDINEDCSVKDLLERNKRLQEESNKAIKQQIAKNKSSNKVKTFDRPNKANRQEVTQDKKTDIITIIAFVFLGASIVLFFKLGG